MISIMKEKAIRKPVDIMKEVIESNDEEPVATAIVEIDGARESVIIQLSTIAMKGNPVNVKPKIRRPPSTGPRVLLTQT
jgi:uncharacterized OB-fold protein